MKRQTWRAALLSFSVLLSAAWTGAQASVIKIVTADTLELRQVDDQEIVVIAGENLELRVDDDIVRAQRVEFNRTRRTLTLVGNASYYSAKDGQRLEGQNLVVELGDQQVTGEDVVISDASLEVRGQQVERIPGQLRATGGYFTTCARCGQTPNDYAFKAERLVVYPGDRLVAYRAQLLLADHPVLFLPVVVLPLNDQERQPRLAFSNDAVDGYTVSADLPFSVGSSTLGTSLLRFYQNRNPSVGFGVALRSFAPLPFVDRVNLYLLSDPKTVGAGPGSDLDYTFTVRGRLPLQLALKDLEYSLNVVRREKGLGTGADSGVTNLNFSGRADYPLFGAEFSFINRYGPELTTALGNPLKLPEVVLDPKPYTSGKFSADLRFTAGQYTAQSNPLSRSATSQGVNITTSRLEEQHTLSYSLQPWRDADLNLSNSFTGRYYGTGARTVNLRFGVKLTQRWASVNTASLEAAYERLEGTSPFAFDALPVSRRVISAPVTFSLNTVPVKDVSFSASYTHNFLKSRDEQGLATFNLNVNRTPLSLSSNLQLNPAKAELESFTYNLTLSDPTAAQTGLTASQPAAGGLKWPAPNLTLSANGGVTRLSGLSPFTVRATITGDLRSNSFSVYATHSLKSPDLDEVGLTLNAAGTRDTVLNPFSVSLSERLYLPTPRLTGSATLSWRAKYQFTSSHDLLLARADTTVSSGTAYFGVGSVAGSVNSWQLTYGGPFDLQRWGFTQPTLVGSLSFTRPGQRLAFKATVNTPGLDQHYLELARADLDANWQFGSRAALSSRAYYARTRSGNYPTDTATDTLVLDPLKVSIGLGRSGTRPAAYLTGTLRQTFSWKDGVSQNTGGLTPVIGLTIDRCCWALQAEMDLLQKRYRLAIGLPGQNFYPLFDLTDTGIDIPLLP